jgi:hypothetical protein
MKTDVKSVWYGVMVIVASQRIYNLFVQIISVAYTMFLVTDMPKSTPSIPQLSLVQPVPWVPAVVSGLFAIVLAFVIIRIINNPVYIKLWVFILILLCPFMPLDLIVVKLLPERLIAYSKAVAHASSMQGLYTLFLFIMGYIKCRRIGKRGE